MCVCVCVECTLRILSVADDLFRLQTDKYAPSRSRPMSAYFPSILCSSLKPFQFAIIKICLTKFYNRRINIIIVVFSWMKLRSMARSMPSPVVAARATWNRRYDNTALGQTIGTFSRKLILIIIYYYRRMLWVELVSVSSRGIGLWRQAFSKIRRNFIAKQLRDYQMDAWKYEATPPPLTNEINNHNFPCASTDFNWNSVG